MNRRGVAIGFLVAMVVGSALAAEVQYPLAVALVNPGFEEGRGGWSEEQFTRFQDLVLIEHKVFHLGNSSLKMSSFRGTENPWLSQSVGELKGGATYALRAWVKADPETKPTLAAVKIEFYNAAGENTSEHYARKAAPGNGNWQAVEVRAKAGPDTVKAAVLLRLFGSGTLWFDDVQFEMVAPPPAMTLDPARQVVKAGKDCSFPVIIRLAEEWPEETAPPVKLTLLVPPKGQEHRPEFELVRHDSRTFEAKLKMPSMQTGTYVVQCAVEGREGGARAAVFVPVEKRKPKYLSDTGTILVGGKPFLPIGLYHVGSADYKAVAQKGFNCVQGPNALELGAFSRGLAQAQTARLMVDVPLYAGGLVGANLAASLKKLNRHRRNAAVLNWKIIDEPDIRPEIMDEVPEAYQALKATDPDHPLSLTLCQPAQYAYWASFCDIFQVDPYPIPGRPLTMVSDHVRAAKQVLEPWQNLTAVLQAGWVPDPLNQPTYAQARVMLYLALVNGAKGIFWYSFSDPGWRLPDTPLWGRFEDLNKETAALSLPILVGTEPVGLKVVADGEEGGLGPLQTLGREHAGKLYVMLANPAEKALRVTITPPEGYLSASLLNGGAATFADGQVVVALEATGAETVVFSKTAETAATEKPKVQENPPAAEKTETTEPTK